jgi:UDP-N-acetyl-D-mannosaminuronic acid dehydrogenase
LKASGRSLQGATVTILGAAYLENSDDTRNTPAAALVGALIAKGAEVRIHDPYVRDWDFGPHEILTDLKEAAKDSDCLALVTKHEDYLSLDLSDLKKIMRTPTVVDGRNVFDQQKMVDNGFEYRCIGKAGIRRS